MATPTSATPATPNKTRRVFSSTLAQGVIRILILLVGLASASLLTRTLGVSGYGTYTVIMIYLSFFTSLSDWGILTILARDLARDPDSQVELTSTITVGRLLLAIPSIALAIGLGLLFYPHSTDIKIGIAIYSLTLATNAIIGPLTSVLQARFRLEIATLAELIGRLVSLGGIVYAATHHRGVQFVIALGVLGALVQAVVLWRSLKDRRTLKLQFKYRLFWRIFLTSLPLGMAVILNSVYYRIDGFLLSLLKPIVDVGIYGAAYKVLDLTILFPSLFGATILPVLAANAHNLPRFRESAQKGVNFMIVLSLPIFAGGYVLAAPIIHLIGGSGFAASSAPLKILLASLVLTSVNMVYGISIIALNKQRNALWINVSALVFNVALNLIFIPRFSYMAAAYNTLLTELYVLLANQWLMRRYAGFMPQLQIFLRAGLATLAMAAVLRIIPHWPVLLLVPIGAVVYGGGLLVFRAISVHEVRELVGR